MTTNLTRREAAEIASLFVAGWENTVPTLAQIKNLDENDRNVIKEAFLIVNSSLQAKAELATNDKTFASEKSFSLLKNKIKTDLNNTTVIKKEESSLFDSFVKMIQNLIGLRTSSKEIFNLAESYRNNATSNLEKTVEYTRQVLETKIKIEEKSNYHTILGSKVESADALLEAFKMMKIQITGLQDQWEHADEFNLDQKVMEEANLDAIEKLSLEEHLDAFFAHGVNEEEDYEMTYAQPLVDLVHQFKSENNKIINKFIDVEQGESDVDPEQRDIDSLIELAYVEKNKIVEEFNEKVEVENNKIAESAHRIEELKKDSSLPEDVTGAENNLVQHSVDLDDQLKSNYEVHENAIRATRDVYKKKRELLLVNPSPELQQILAEKNKNDAIRFKTELKNQITKLKMNKAIIKTKIAESKIDLTNQVVELNTTSAKIADMKARYLI